MTADISSSTQDFALPDVGEGLTEADIVSWKVAPGDTVTVNQVLVEIETAKSLVELPSPQAGTIAALLVPEGETVDVGTPIVRFGDAGAAGSDGEGASAAAATAPTAEAPAGTADAAPSDSEESGPNLVGYGAKGGSKTRRARRRPGTSPVAPPAAATASEDAAATAPVDPSGASAGDGAGTTGSGTGRALAKPPVRKLAKDRGVDLARVPATGARGEVTREDLLRFLDGGAATDGAAGNGAATGAASTAGRANGTAGPAAGDGDTVSAGAGASAGVPGLHGPGPREETHRLGGVGKAMARAMTQSAFTVPHVTEFLDVDVTRTMEFVRHLKTSGLLGEGVKVSPLVVMAKAALWAAGRNPMMTASLDGDTVTVRNYVNLGIAAATPRGLVVPNIKDAHALGLGELAQAINDLARTAREGRTTPAAQAGGTFTITNVGVFGVDTGTPIINPGESAIIAFGQVKQRPWVVDGELGVREVATISVSADHRVVDGEVISRFLADIGRALEEPLTLLV